MLTDGPLVRAIVATPARQGSREDGDIALDPAVGRAPRAIEVAVDLVSDGAEALPAIVDGEAPNAVKGAEVLQRRRFAEPSHGMRSVARDRWRGAVCETDKRSRPCQNCLPCIQA